MEGKGLRDNLLTSCKLLRDTGSKHAGTLYAHCKIYFGNKKALDESNQGVTQPQSKPLLSYMGLHFRQKQIIIKQRQSTELF